VVVLVGLIVGVGAGGVGVKNKRGDGCLDMG
jgi:hypothetical protein